MRRIDRVRLGMVFVLATLLMAPAAGWARVFNYARLHYFFLPIQMQFADRDTGNPIGKSSNMVMYGGRSREFAVDAVDFNRNGVIDIRDFNVWPVAVTVSVDILISGDPDVLAGDLSPDVDLNLSPVPPDLSTDELLRRAPQLRERFEAAFLDALGSSFGHVYQPKTTSSVSDLLDVTMLDASNVDFYNSREDPRVVAPVPLPRRLLLCRVTPKQQLGDKGSDYKEQLAQLKYTIFFGPIAKIKSGSDREKIVERSETTEMNVLVRPTDQGGKGGDNGGGSCDALALGAVALLVPGLFLLRRGKTQAKG